MRSAILLFVGLALVGCSNETVVRTDPDYKAINEAARAPAAPITPDVISFADIEAHNLFDAGCNVLSPDGEGLLLIADDEAAHFLLDNTLISLVPHPGSDELPYGTFAHYDGLAHAVELAIDEESGQQQGSELTNYDGRLTIFDERDRIVFEHAGKIECGA